MQTKQIKATKTPEKEAGCVVRLDRVGMVAPHLEKRSIRRIPRIEGFQVRTDRRVRPQAKVATYRRVQHLENPETGTKLFIQYDRAHGWLKPVRITAVANDKTGILLPDLERITKAFHYDIVVNMAELSFDFDPRTGVDLQYVLRHVLFGKSRPTHNPAHPNSLRYGTRHSAKLVRVYHKNEISAFRVELELHPTWMRLFRDNPTLIYLLPVGPEEFRFVNFSWHALDASLARKGAQGRRLAKGARNAYATIHGLLTYLRRHGVNNPHRFLRTAKKDALVRNALDTWSAALDFHKRRNDHEEQDETAGI